LAKTRDQQLYREEFSSFGAYYEQHGRIHRSYTYELIAAAEVAQNLSGIPDTPPLTKVSQARTDWLGGGGPAGSMAAGVPRHEEQAAHGGGSQALPWDTASRADGRRGPQGH